MIFQGVIQKIFTGSDTHDVFFSYSNADEAVAVDLERRLVSNGISVWRDRQSILAGSQWSQEIERALGSCRVLVALVTPAFCRSRWTPYEVERVRGRVGVFAPIRVVPCLWQGTTPDYLSELQAIDFRTDKKTAFTRLVRDLWHILNVIDQGQQTKSTLIGIGADLVNTHIVRTQLHSAAAQILQSAHPADVKRALVRRRLPISPKHSERIKDLLTSVDTGEDVGALVDELFTVQSLKDILRANDLSPTGNKHDLVARLLAHFEVVEP